MVFQKGEQGRKKRKERICKMTFKRIGREWGKGTNLPNSKGGEWEREKTF